MAKHPKLTVFANVVRTRRAYFDCKFGQLHVRTAFPATGGFDEGVPLFCLHDHGASGRMFTRFLPEMADVRSVYAPDLPGYGESDPPPAESGGSGADPAAQASCADAAAAAADLAADLRLRQIDVLGFRFGAGVALDLAQARPELVRRLVLVGVPLRNQLHPIDRESLVLRIKLGASDDSQWIKGILPKAQLVDLTELPPDLFDAAPRTLSKQIGAFLKS